MTLTKPELLSLAEDLRSATEGTRDLGDRVLIARGWKAPFTHSTPGTQEHEMWLAPSGKLQRPDWRPNPTTNLQHAVEALKPEWEWQVNGGPNGPLWATIWTPGQSGGWRQHDSGDAATPSLALSAAIVAALAEEAVE